MYHYTIHLFSLLFLSYTFFFLFRLYSASHLLHCVPSSLSLFVFSFLCSVVSFIFPHNEECLLLLLFPFFVPSYYSRSHSATSHIIFFCPQPHATIVCNELKNKRNGMKTGEKTFKKKKEKRRKDKIREEKREGKKKEWEGKREGNVDKKTGWVWSE
ncbi:hypothetical protein, unlikely [Trypanosoma brucei gambiense DAL972]|uniref:Uncharacterized protein n=1 Tax=Trypanosoma brucei gambiense (strain MHOM/CI/86/DAL972) TaxID=679716 RepID=D0A164_TRYB9|nr:hypothetical protein, unlikely [Trypanosoma brucei gambiense DAL972]CBH15006.1 hypothetical protein, unlikely [Trypanosoma brucei gambiense DAL972]|eukprot:XP_011777272.1 hypothetical protein, unlikely [Trypanosoma brucei gambiense DAL972]